MHYQEMFTGLAVCKIQIFIFGFVIDTYITFHCFHLSIVFRRVDPLRLAVLYMYSNAVYKPCGNKRKNGGDTQKHKRKSIIKGKRHKVKMFLNRNAVKCSQESVVISNKRKYMETDKTSKKHNYHKKQIFPQRRFFQIQSLTPLILIAVILNELHQIGEELRRIACEIFRAKLLAYEAHKLVPLFYLNRTILQLFLVFHFQHPFPFAQIINLCRLHFTAKLIIQNQMF